jgi:5-methylcytosine-specific restriction endonuclease McrA
MAKTKRPNITARMKVNCLLDRVFQQFGAYLKCSLSGEDMKPEDPVEFDHTHALVHKGEHSWEALRPVLKEPHKRKSKSDVRDAAHVSRLVKERKGRPKRKRRSRKIPPRPFPGGHRPLQSRGFQKRATQ